METIDRLLLLMTTNTYRAGAFLDAARRLGIPLVVGTDKAQVLSAVNPSGNLTLNFLSPQRAVRRIVEFARRQPIRAVIAADDDGAILAAMAAEALGLGHNSVKSVLSTRNKRQMRAILAKEGVISPRFQSFQIDQDPSEIARKVAYPCVVKPLFLSAGRGVIRADDPQQFVAAFRRVSGLLRRPDVAAQGGGWAGEVLVESFVEGVEVTVEGLLSDGRLRVLAIFDKPDPLDGPFFEETIYVTPSRLPAEVQQDIADRAANAVRALGLRAGPVHAEFRVNDKGAWILEIASRSIGGLCSRALRFSDGTSLEELILRHALGHDVTSLTREERASGVMMIPIPKAGILREVKGLAKAKETPGVEDIRITIPIGQEVIPPPEGTRYLGFIFARDGTPERVEGALRQAHEQLTFEITQAVQADHQYAWHV